MKHILQLVQKIALLITLLCLFKMPCGIAQNFSFKNWNKDSNAILTVNAFRSVTIDKRGIVWVGSDLGGLYNFKENTWKKINTYPDVTFRHMVPSNIAADSNVWATSIGKTAVQAITGGAYLINTKTETVTQYGSGIAGGLSARFANSLALSSTGSVYVALAQSLTGTTTNQGGVFFSNTVNPPMPSSTSFTRAIQDAGEINYYAAGNRGDELWFGRGASCVNGVCQAPYIAVLNSKGDKLPSITAAISGLPFTNSNTVFTRAIFTDTITGNTFVGLNSGGIGVCRNDGTWKMLTSANSPFPAGAAVNFNAIENVFGEIWVGTSFGVFVYNGTGSLDSMGSFKMLTTANGLPTSSITDIAVDTARSDIWITSPVGVSRAPYTPPFIKGIVYDVFCNRPGSALDSLKLYESLQKKPITAGVKVKLLENGILKDSSETDADGVFELKNAEDGKVYSVEIKFKKDGNEILYRYAGIKNHTLMGAILIPDSLIREIKAFKPKMVNRCFKVKMPFLITSSTCREGFYVAEYDQSFEPFYNANGIQMEHKKQVENLADFYVALATVYSLGGTSTELMGESLSNAFDAIQSIGAFVKFGNAIKTDAVVLGEAKKKILFTTLKLMKEGYFWGLKKVSSTLAAYPEAKDAKEIIDNAISFISDMDDLGLSVLESGPKDAGIDFLIDVVKKEMALQISSTYYRSYCVNRHKNFIKNAAPSSKNALSGFTFDQTFNRLYSTSANSLVKYAQDTFTVRKDKIETLGTIAKVAAYAASVGDAATALALIPGGQLAGAIAKGVATAAKVVRTSALTFAMLEGALGCVQVSAISSKILTTTGFTNLKPARNYNKGNNPPSQLSPASLLAQKNNYNLKLTELKAIYNRATYDSAIYYAKYNEFATADSLYTIEMTKALNALWASADSALTKVPTFAGKLERVVDSFVTQQYSTRQTFFYQNLGYIFDTDKSGYVPELNTLADEIIKWNDSAVNGLNYLVDDINLNGIAAPAYLVQDGYVLNHSHQPGSSGSFTYTFKNYGTTAINNVSFKLSPPTKGYQFTSADSIYAGTILAGASRQITFSFTSPLTDSLCRYTIDVEASNGSFIDVTGSLYVNDPARTYTVKSGNWSDVNTWSNKTVPNSASKVMVSHTVTVDVDATCKSVNSINPGSILVNTGKRLTILK